MIRKEAIIHIGTLRTVTKDIPKYSGTAIDEAVEMAIKALEQEHVQIPEDATNGDVIKAVFPSVEIKEKNNGYEVYFGVGTATQYFNYQWWNTPYKVESEGEEKMYARGNMKRPEWLLQRFLHDLTSQMGSVECGLPGFPPLWQPKTDCLEDEYYILVKPLYGSTDMHYEVRGACRDVLEKVSEEIAFTKRNIKSENREYLTGYLAALSGVEGLIAEVRANEGL